MLHHVSLGTRDLNRARRFYDAVMAELGLRRTLNVDQAVGYGAGITVFSLNLPADGAEASVGNGVHVAFEVEKRAAVDAFFAWRWHMELRAMAHLAHDRNMIPITTPRLFAILMVTRSKSSPSRGGKMHQHLGYRHPGWISTRSIVYFPELFRRSGRSGQHQNRGS